MVQPRNAGKQGKKRQPAATMASPPSSPRPSTTCNEPGPTAKNLPEGTRAMTMRKLAYLSTDPVNLILTEKLASRYGLEVDNPFPKDTGVRGVDVLVYDLDH